mgnify:FL=1
MTHLGNDWDELLKEETAKPYMSQLREFLREEYRAHTIYPPMEEIFTALRLTPFHEVKAVILGQDPYHQPRQAMGMSFSVREGVTVPPSLRNIYQEIESSTGAPSILAQRQTGDLTPWAEQGVLLLNTVLTVRRGQPGSHRGKGWEEFTDFIISLLNQRQEPIVFLLWGADAKRKQSQITNPAHTILTAPHPSPYSADRGFFGCGHFAAANAAIQSAGGVPIQW